MNYFKIAITGGPCAGKSETIKSVSEYISKNYNVNLIIIPETATELINSGITPLLFKDIKDFQRVVLTSQLSKEENAIYTIGCIGEDKPTIMLCDRGILDNKAYFDKQSDFDFLLYQTSYSEIEFLDSYDLVIDLISTSNSSFGEYDLISNKARHEEAEEAKKLDNRTSTAWVGHSNLFLVDCCKTLEEKEDKVIKIIDNFINKRLEKEIYSFEIDRDLSDLSIYDDDNSKKIIIDEILLKPFQCKDFNHIISSRTYKGKTTYSFRLEQEEDNVKKIIYDKKISSGTFLKLKDSYYKEQLPRKILTSFIYEKQLFNICNSDGKLKLETITKEIEKLPENISLKVGKKQKRLKKSSLNNKSMLVY